MRPRTFLFAAIFALVAGTAGAGPAMQLLVPAYQYPTLGTLWADLASASATVPVTAILDPANGPGTFIDPNYTAAVNALRASGGHVIGYVSTHYAAIDTATVLSDARRYASFYAVDGIFLDEMSSDAAHVPHYAALAAALRAFRPQWSLTGNPGVACDAGYATVAGLDQIITFEHSLGYETWSPEPWMLAQPPSRFAHLLYGVPDAAAMRAAVALAAHRNVGAIYVTDDTLANPWDTLPPWWLEERTEIAATQVASAGDAPHGSAALHVLGSGTSRIAFRLAPRQHARALTVHDAQGRALCRIPVPAGAISCAWDGRSGAGASCASGVYFARLAAGTGGTAATARFVRLR